MAQGSQDKTEKPTSKRRQKSRERGQVAKSQELNNVTVLLAGLIALQFLGVHFYTNITDHMRQVFLDLNGFHLSQESVPGFFFGLARQFLAIVLPFFLVVALAALFINLAQVGFLLAPKRLMPSFDKINPMKGLGRMFSSRSAVELLKSLGKLLVVGFAAYQTMAAEWDRLPTLGDMAPEQMIVYLAETCLKLFWRCLIAMIVLAVMDWAYQKWQFEKGLKMSKQEVKDEFRQSEGDPQVKSRIRSLQREKARQRMMAQVPKADVVITNPTHLAVALLYKVDEMDAPEVVAKGANKIAERIKEEARKAGVPVIEDKPLAQALFRTAEVGQRIPADLYQAVATILAHVYRLKNRQREVLRGRRAKS